MFAVLGLGVRSTMMYLERLHQKYHALHGDYATCPFHMYQVDFNTLNPYLPNKFESLVPQLDVYLNELKQMGFDKLLIPNITLHETVDQLEHDFQLAHPLQLTVDCLKRVGGTETVIFATSYTMNSPYLRSYFEKRGIKCIVPNEQECLIIDQYRTALFHHQEDTGIETAFYQILEHYMTLGSVTLACTELAINIPQDKSVISMVDLQIQHCINSFL